LWAGAFYMLLISAVWTVETLNTFTYNVVTGFLFVIFVCQYVIPVVFFVAPSRSGLVVSGAALALACFCAYSNGVASVLLILSGVPLILYSPTQSMGAAKFFLKYLGLGAGIVMVPSGAWFLRHGDLKGYFIYHIYFNQHIYAKY